MNLKTETVEFWGRSHEITPVILDETFGDGKKSICLTPLNTRPNYYIVNIDSSVDLLENDSVIDYLEKEDGVLNYIIEEYGECCGDDEEPFPALNLDCGYCWGEYKQDRPKDQEESQNQQQTQA